MQSPAGVVVSAVMSHEAAAAVAARGPAGLLDTLLTGPLTDIWTSISGQVGQNHGPHLLSPTETGEYAVWCTWKRLPHCFAYLLGCWSMHQPSFKKHDEAMISTIVCNCRVRSYYIHAWDIPITCFFGIFSCMAAYHEAVAFGTSFVQVMPESCGLQFTLHQAHHEP